MMPLSCALARNRHPGSSAGAPDRVAGWNRQCAAMEKVRVTHLSPRLRLEVPEDQSDRELLRTLRDGVREAHHAIARSRVAVHESMIALAQWHRGTADR